MNTKEKTQILLTNDDSINSPGLWAAAEALAPLGFVHVVAPRVQQTSMGRALPRESDGIVEARAMTVNGKEWQVYAVGGSPAQAFLHGYYEVLGFKPDLVVSGINYGENVASGITISGTVGAALEAATLGSQRWQCIWKRRSASISTFRQMWIFRSRGISRATLRKSC